MKPTARNALPILIVLPLMPGCDRGGEPARPVTPATPTVTVTEVVRRSVPRTARYIATTEAAKSVTVRARVEGFLDERLFTEGDLVAEGDLLYRIDPSPLEAALRAAEADLATNQAALTRAQAELTRFEALLAKRDLSQETYDSALAAEKEAKARVASSQAAVDQATLNLGYASIAAPLGGRIGESRVDVGNLVGPAENAELATIVQLDPIHVGFRPGGDDIDAITIRQRQAPVPVTVTLPDGSIPPHRGTIDFIDNRADPASGTLKMRAVIPNPDGLLLPGRHARVEVDLGEQPDALLVPQRALVQNQGGFLVYVVDDAGKVQERQVEAGPAVGALRLVESGVRAGERVVVDGVQQVRTGSVVKTRPAATPGADTGAEPSSVAPAAGRKTDTEAGDATPAKPAS
jgi:RND family efflux transporter MFP subunit